MPEDRAIGSFIKEPAETIRDRVFGPERQQGVAKQVHRMRRAVCPRKKENRRRQKTL